MKSEKLKALTFIVVGCIGATALGFTVWQASSPARPTHDIAMHTTTSTSPTPARYESPAKEPLLDEEPDPSNQVLAAVDTADPYLPPNAYVRPNTNTSARPQAALPTREPTASSVVQASPETAPGTEQSPDPSTSERPDTDESSPDPQPTQTQPTTPAPTDPPELTPPPLTSPTEDAEDDTTEPEEPGTLTPVEPTDPITPSDTDGPTSTPLPEDDADLTPEEPSPTDFVDEPTVPLNPNIPAEPGTATDTRQSTAAATSEARVDPATQDDLVGALN